MPAKFTFAKVFAAFFSFLVFPFLIKGQCAPEISALFQPLSLDYFDENNLPLANLSGIDVNLENGGPLNTTYNVMLVESSWQTTGTADFSNIELTGSITINYVGDLPSDVCEYIDGIYNDLLPVELSVFKAHLMGNNVFLNWSTESEIDNAGFQIERSFDGENYERIAFQNGAGQSDEKLWYSFQDLDVKNAALGGIAYYRLKQINYDQTFSYSEVVAVDLKLNLNGFHITKVAGWNNPDRLIKVYYNNLADTRKINVIVATINGKIIQQKSLYPQPGFNFFEIDLSNQKDNLFFISLNNGKEIKVEKLILHSKD